VGQRIDELQEGSVSNTSVQKSKLVQYLNLRAEQLKTDLRGARLFIGTTDTGNIAEHAVREFLISLVPAKYSVGVGEVINAEGTIPNRTDQSQQKDVVIYDQYINTILGWGSSNTSLFPVESVYGILEPVFACLLGALPPRSALDCHS
jgi:hypothetical protein